VVKFLWRLKIVEVKYLVNILRTMPQDLEVVILDNEWGDFNAVRTAIKSEVVVCLPEDDYRHTTLFERGNVPRGYDEVSILPVVELLMGEK